MNVRSFLIGWMCFYRDPWCLASLYKFDFQSVAIKPFMRYIHSRHVFFFPPHSRLVIWNHICMYTSPHQQLNKSIFRILDLLIHIVILTSCVGVEFVQSIHGDMIIHIMCRCGMMYSYMHDNVIAMGIWCCHDYMFMNEKRLTLTCNSKISN